MIQRDKHSAIPTANLRCVISQRVFMIFEQLERLKSNSTERHYYARIYELNRAAQKVRAIAKLLRAWPPIRARCASRIAERGARDEDLRSRQAGRVQEPVEVFPGLVTRKRNARPICAFAPRRFTDEHHARVDRAIQVT